jgi:malate dehydrogenase (oxaloacetate-decarboxylating)
MARRIQEVILIETRHRPGRLASALNVLGAHQITLEHLHVVQRESGWTRWEITIEVTPERLASAVEALGNLPDVRYIGKSDRVFRRHRGGKVIVRPSLEIASQQILRDVYTPGVATICTAIGQDPELAWTYTIKGRSVAVVSNGTAVLGLGNIGPLASLPVIEGKAALLASLVDVVAFPIALRALDVATVVAAVAAIEPGFGAILLEDFAAPDCFAIESQLQAKLKIPVMHDDQHGTAAVVLGTLLRVCRRTGKPLHELRVGQVGLGAAGLGICRLLARYGVQSLRGTDIRPEALDQLRAIGGVPDTLQGVMRNCDAVVLTTGVSGLVTPDMIQRGQIVLSLSNPDPEIDPIAAQDAGAIFAADGKIINNVLGFPGIFRGALDARATAVTDAMLIAAAEALADQSPEADVAPNPLDRAVHAAVAARVCAAALAGGAAISRGT